MGPALKKSVSQPLADPRLGPQRIALEAGRSHMELARSALRLFLIAQVGVCAGLGPGIGANASRLSRLLSSPPAELANSEPETAEAASSFLFSRDPATLLRANCTKRLEIRAGSTGHPSARVQSLVRGAVDALVHATNFLNLVFQTNDLRETSVKDEIEWYHALVRSIVEADANIDRAVLILDVPTIPSKSQLVLQAAKRQNAIYLRELSSIPGDLENQTVDNDWFNAMKHEKTPDLNKWILTNDLRTLDSPKWGLGHSYMTDKKHVQWSSPFLDCEDFKFIPKWMMSLSSSFYGLKPDLSPEFKGVIRMDVNLQSMDIDQCSTEDTWFADSHQCDVNSTEQIRASGLLLLETILGGSILLYFPVFILCFQPSVFRCVLLRWVRTLGFAIIYGTVTLKIYRVLKVFLSRTAQRVPYMTCCRVLKMLGVIVLTVCWFLIAWTLAAWENMDRKIPLVIQSQTPDGQLFNMCQLDRWDYMMAIAELLLLCWGSYLCYAVRTVPSTYHEPRFMGLAIHNEILMSAAFYGVRFTMATTLHPDWMLLLFFVHSHLTVTMTLILLFIPKFLHVGAPLREDIVAEVYEDELDLRFSGSYLNSSFTSAWSDHSLEPDDIRDELKKLYAQLEVHKTKKMTANNPHLQKKRSSRRALGRSIIKRITEIPESMSRQCSRDGSIAGSSYAGSYRKKLHDSASSSLKVKEDSIKHRVFSIRKSHSTYDHVREQREGHISRADSSRDPSLLDSLMRKKLAKKVSEASDTDSLDDAPLVCKSASAHNLTVDMNPLNPAKGGTLHKSLSVVSCARGKSLMLPRKKEENSKQLGERVQRKPSTRQTPTMLQPPAAPAQSGETNKISDSAMQQGSSEILQRTAKMLLQDGHNKPLVCPWDFQNLHPQPSETKVNKQITYSPNKRNSVDSSLGKLQANRKIFTDLVRKHRSLHQDSIGYNVKEKSITQSQTTDMQPGANTSPRAGKTGEYLRKDSINPAAPAVSPKADKTQSPSEKIDQVKTDAPVGESKREKYMTLMKQASSNSSIVCPWDNMADDTSSVDSCVDHKKGRSLSVCVGSPEQLMHASLKVKDANEPLKQPKGFGHSLKLLMAPEKMKGSKKEKSRKVSEKLKGGTDKEKKKTGSATSLDKSTPAAVCPWEAGETKNQEVKSQSLETSSAVDASPLRKVDTVDKREKYMTLMKQASSNSSIVCPWDNMADDASSMDSCVDEKKGRSLSVCVASPEQLMHGSLKVKDANEPLKQPKGFGHSLKLLMAPEKMKGSKKEKSRKVSEKLKGGTDKEKKKTGSTTSLDKSTPAAVCPWETGETKNREEKSQSVLKSEVADASPLRKMDTGDKRQKYMSLLKQASASTAIVCPWDVILEEASGNRTDQKKGRSLSLSAGVPGSIVHGTLKANDANYSLQQSKQLALSFKLMMAPGKTWDKENSAERSQSIDKSKVADICPWDVGNTANKQETSQSIDKSKVTDICPWDTGNTRNKQETSQSIDKSKVADICPWDTGNTGNKQETSQSIDKSKVADICPWDTGNTGNKQETSQSIDKSKVADICPWDTGNTGNKLETSQSIDKSKVADICPWDTGNTGNKQETSQSIDKSKVADICPWDTGNTGNKQETSQSIDKSKVADICPWDTGNTGNKQETSQSIDKSKVTDIYPWDTGNTGNKQETSQSIDKSKVADICPWDTGNTGDKQETSQSIDKSKVADICPWDTGNTGNKQETSQSIDKSKVTDICPWDTGNTGNKQETSQSIDKSKVADICPWDTGNTGNKQETSQSIDKSKVTDICPWDTGNTGNKQETSQSIDKSKVTDICLWDTGNTGNKQETSQSIDKSKVTDICLWDTGNTGNKEETSQIIDKSKVTDICPWDVENAVGSEQKSLPGDKFKVTVIYPSDAENTERKGESFLSSDKSKVSGNCFIDSEDSACNEGLSLPIDRSKVPDICLWETDPKATGEIQMGTKPESNFTSVSLSETEVTAANQHENKEAEKPKDHAKVNYLNVSRPMHLV
ncbi:probable G-protein coupled receptor 179 isoform X2 [Stegostoma tigrinum]|uniref:probable G-protein coupled receptor 179 isoform X2 n=1 Tax=Stegostoma tigrinum TaxID=3053191 RepID=UPI002870B093|nr:probable G-protein coupled receptor 179 isoform X2 [Stegostoma tigrinum]